VTVSGGKWDVRAAIIDSSPVRGRPFFGDNKPPRMTNVVAGAGFTPYIGLRFGAAFGTGPYAAEREVRDKTRGARRATLAQVEGEWAFRHTRMAGEFLWTRRELATACSRRRATTINGPSGSTFRINASATNRIAESKRPRASG
jgi:hypothetical protein